jgi:hypothetical protein
MECNRSIYTYHKQGKCEEKNTYLKAKEINILVSFKEFVKL